MDKYCTICKKNELLTLQEKANEVCNVCFGKVKKCSAVNVIEKP